MRDLVSLFAALADPTRLRLLHLMKDGEICVCFLQGVLKTSQPKISRHLAYLRNAGLVEARKEGKWIHYRLKKIDDAGPAQILAEVLRQVAAEPDSGKNACRLEDIRCCPTKYGLSSPLPARKPVKKPTSAKSPL